MSAPTEGGSPAWRRHARDWRPAATVVQPRTVPVAVVVDWLVEAAAAWNGPRLREAMQRADRKRRSRPDESGVLAAFGDSASLPRARASEDAREAALHSIDCVALLRAEALGNDARGVCETLILKLVHNALEAVGFSDFGDRHVVLACMRDLSIAQRSGEVTHVHRIVELTDGFVVTPHMPWYAARTMSLVQALALWYPAVFGDEVARARGGGE